MKASGSGRWLSVTTVIHIVLASIVISTPVHADQPLHASLDFSIEAGAYNNSVPVGPISRATLVIDRDPASPFHDTIYAIGIRSSSQCNYPYDWQLQVARSVDGGHTFGTPSSLPLCLGGIIDAAIGRNGTLFVASPNGVFRSVDGGQSWNMSLALGASSIAADRATGDVYAGSVDGGGPWTLRISSTRDDGLSWSEPFNISDNTQSAPPQIAAYRSSVVVAFLENPPDQDFGTYDRYVLTVATSRDGGLTWPYVAALSPNAVSQTPSIDVSPSGLIGSSWSEIEGGNASTLIAVSSDGGQTFSKPVQPGGVPGVPGIYGHAVAFDDASRLYVTWHSTNPNYSSTIYVAISSDYGERFENASFTTTVTGRYVANGTYRQSLVAGSNDTMFLIWGGTFEDDIRTFVRTVSGQAKGEVAFTGQPPSGTPVELVLRDQSTAAVQARVPWDGSTVVLDELRPSVYDVWIEVGNASALSGGMPVRTWNRTAFTVHVEGGPIGPGTPPFPWPTAAAVGGVVVFLAAALVELQHTRLAREQVLQRKIRLLLYEAIQEDPGSSFTKLRDALGLRNGVAAYHLSVLEKQGLVHTEKGRRHRWYYPNGDVSLWRDLPLSPLQKSLVEQVRQAPGIGIRELARNLNRHHASVAYNVRGLAREGLLRTQRTGRKVHCFPMDADGTE